MKIEKRYIVGGLMLVPFLPVLLLGFVTFWLHWYATAGFDMGEELAEVIDKWLAKGEQE